MGSALGRTFVIYIAAIEMCGLAGDVRWLMHFVFATALPSPSFVSAFLIFQTLGHSHCCHVNLYDPVHNESAKNGSGKISI
jgi:hypothetical protein